MYYDLKLVLREQFLIRKLSFPSLLRSVALREPLEKSTRQSCACRAHLHLQIEVVSIFSSLSYSFSLTRVIIYF